MLLRRRLGVGDDLLRLVELGLLRVQGTVRALVTGRLDQELLRGGVLAVPQPRVRALGERTQVQALARAHAFQRRGGTDVALPRLPLGLVAVIDLDLRGVGRIVPGHVQAPLGADIAEVEVVLTALQRPLLGRAAVAGVDLHRRAVGFLAARDIQAVARRARHLDHDRTVADPAQPASRPVVLPAGGIVRDPRLAEDLPQGERAILQRLGGGDVGTEDLLALRGLRGNLLLPLGGRLRHLLAQNPVRVDRGVPGTRGEAGLQILDRDAVLRGVRGWGRAREAAGAQEDPGVIGEHPGNEQLVGFDLPRVLLPDLPRLLLLRCPPGGVLRVADRERGGLRLVVSGGRRIVERGEQVDRLEVRLVQPRNQAGLVEDLELSGRLVRVGAQAHDGFGKRRLLVIGLLEPLVAAGTVRVGGLVQGRVVVGEVPLELLVELVGRQPDAVLREGEQVGPALAQGVDGHTLILAQLLSRFGVEAVVRVARRGHRRGALFGAPAELRARLDRQATEDGQSGDGRDSRG